MRNLCLVHKMDFVFAFKWMPQELAGHEAGTMYIKWRIPHVQQSARNSGALSKVSHADRTGTPEDTQLDWDRPVESYL